ncbi:Heme A synthase, cytochrome oxidase biogenesis protein Cox15-CtaA [hydrothermal vent metagenome]|uniref:Heme A synthase, cytochrome oxidase biogenesis protein Cox15-CtaA n=1 Tax=hydrothermal vent metagenome TaxID=652676 RepID=A0A3B0RNX0_9ZZZZ
MSEKRSIFEEVSGEGKPAEQTKGMIDQGRGQGARRMIRVWLMGLFALVVAVIVVGGLTRLTDSGLSITEWKPVTGAWPPMSEAAWSAEFAKYQAIPEFQIQNQWMQLTDFKGIYWWEWGHRQLGRTIGLVWFIGFLAFWGLRKIPVGWTGRLFFIGVLGGLQGALGWWMVRSGLSGGMLDVASYRLAMHLGLAFVILGFIGWFVLLLGREERVLMQARRGREAGLVSGAGAWMGLAFVQVLIGALVAGIDAGRSYTDWPLMAGRFLPAEMWRIEPVWRNLFENPGTVQFIHRMVGYALLIFAIWVWRRGRRSANRATRAAFSMAFMAICGQVLLGIVTVIYGAPWQVAILHQLLAVVVWVLILRARFLSQYPLAQSLREG